MGYSEKPNGKSNGHYGTGEGVVGNSTQGINVRAELQIDDLGFIKAARFRTQGPQSAQRISSWVAAHITGHPVDEALHLGMGEIMRGTDLPPEECRCASLMVQAIRSAVADRVVHWGPGPDWWRGCGFGQRWWRYW